MKITTNRIFRLPKNKTGEFPTGDSIVFRESAKHPQQVVQDDIQLQETPNSHGLHLRQNAESLFLPHKDAKGTLVLYHGYTGGPWQYREMAEDLHQSGYNIYVPRMPCIFQRNQIANST